MKIIVLYIGDFLKKNGPSRVDINITNNLNSLKINKEQINRKINVCFIKKIFISDIINVSGVSLKGLLALIFAKIFNKKSTFIMHGTLKIEKEYRKVKKYRIVMEYLQIKLANKIICVSKKLSDLVKKNYCLNNLAICHINNGIDLKKNISSKVKKDKYLALTTGGGRKEKGIIYICKAIEKLNDKNIKLIVVGEDGLDTEKIKKYKFVDYLGFVSHDILLHLMRKSNIFIQNSLYEPYCISVLEAIESGCKLILSNNIGALEIININNRYIVKYNDVDSICFLINELMNMEKNVKIDMMANTWEEIANAYLKVWHSLWNKSIK